jgi:hypothetical protein
MHMRMQIAVTSYYITLLHTHRTPTVVLRIDSCSQSTFTWLAGELQLQFHMVNHADLFCVPLCPSIYHHDRDRHERQSVAPPTVGRLVAIKQKLDFWPRPAGMAVMIRCAVCWHGSCEPNAYSLGPALHWIGGSKRQARSGGM